LADHEKKWNAYLEKYESWLADVNSQNLDFRSVERVRLEGMFEAPHGSLREAAKHASLIVLATVDRVEFAPSLTAKVHLRVEKTLKGVATPELVVIQQGGPQPHDQDWQGIVLAESDVAPLLLPGDRALLFLDQDGGQYYVQAHTGELRIANDHVTALKTHPARASLDGKTVSEATELVLAGLN
jgi:hypothetical protein